MHKLPVHGILKKSHISRMFCMLHHGLMKHLDLQVLTHMKEKLQFVEKDNQALKAQVADLDAQLTANRDSLTKMKSARDTMRTKGRNIKDSSLYVTNPELLQDMEVRTISFGSKFRQQCREYTTYNVCVGSRRASCRPPYGTAKCASE
jgi:hypothetical protein